MTYTLGGSSLGTVTKEDSTKDAQLFQMPMPLSDSTQAIMLDLFGVSRTISISGVYTTADGTISTFITWLDGLVNGTQSSIVYHSDKSGANYNVLIMNARWSSEEGAVSKVNYDITLVEGAT